MNRAMHHRRFLADVLHDVDFTFAGPAGMAGVGAEQPESRPDSLPTGNLDTRFKAAVGLLEFFFGLQACRCVPAEHSLAIAVPFAARSDDKISVLNLNVLYAIGVILEFVVAPAVATRFDNPLGAVRHRSIAAIELVAPHERPRGMICRSRSMLRTRPCAKKTRKNGGEHG